MTVPEIVAAVAARAAAYPGGYGDVWAVEDRGAPDQSVEFGEVMEQDRTWQAEHGEPALVLMALQRRHDPMAALHTLEYCAGGEIPYANGLNAQPGTPERAALVEAIRRHLPAQLEATP